MAEPRAERPYMPDYGVEPESWNPLPWSWAAERLNSNQNFWVVTVSGGGRPHAMPVWAVWHDPEGRLAFSCGPRARKLRNLAVNPKATIMVDSTVECVSVEGGARRLTDPDRREEWIDRYLAKYQPLEPSLNRDFMLDNVIVEFVAQRAFGVIERPDDFSTRPTRWVFDAAREP